MTPSAVAAKAADPAPFQAAEPATSAEPTLADVARLAGVSSATASRVLTGSSRVRPETRRKVEHAIAQLGYVRNRAARAARPSRVSLIALVVGEDSVRVFADPFFARILWRISTALATADLLMVQLTLKSDRDYRAVPGFLRSGHVDGALFVSVHAKPDFDLGSLGVPVVACGRPVTGSDRVSYVDAGNAEGARKAVAHLLGSGRKAVATIAGPPDMSAGVDRLLGYRQAMVTSGPTDPGLTAYGDFGPASGEHALCRLIDHRPGLDAVFAASDLMALGAVRALRRLGRRIPDDVAVFGFDDAPFAAHTEPPLSTVRQPVEGMADRMVAELITRIADGDAQPAHVVLDTQLMLRDSA